MIAIILAGGYATRLQQLSKNLPKPLLKVAGKAIVEHILDKIAEIEDIEHVIISTNLRFEQQFREWLGPNLTGRAEIVADRSRSEMEKPGAIASLAQLTSGISDDCLIVAGDNLFKSSLNAMFGTFRAKSCATVALYDVKDQMLAKQYSTVTIDSDGRILSLNEKPADPETTLVGACIYMLPDRTLNRLREYLAEAVDRDRPGRFIEWLCKREPVYGHILDGRWWDIGTVGQYYEANHALYVERVLSPRLLGNVQPAILMLKDLAPVLYDSVSCRDLPQELPLYEVYGDLCGEEERGILLKYGLRYEVTVMPSMMLGEEYVKTVGHRHLPRLAGWSYPEVFEVLEGEARFLIQRYRDEEMVDVSLVKAEAGDKVLVPPNCGHVMINAFSSRLVVGNLVSRFCLHTYRPFIERRGAAYYLLEGDRLVRNQFYSSPPDVRMVEAEALPSVDERLGLLVSLSSGPESFAFLNHPWKFKQVTAAGLGR